MSKHLVLVADSSRARFFTAEKANKTLTEIESISHPEGRLHTRNITSDLPGRHVGNKNTGTDTYQSATDPKEQEMIDFAKYLDQHIEQLINEHKVSRLSLIAAPRFLGILRRNLSSQAEKIISFELDKDLVQHSLDDIQKHLS